MFKRKKKKHLQELNRIRCQRYYQRHKQEIRESRKYGSIRAYRKLREKIIKEVIEAQEQRAKKIQELTML
jgi:ribosomal protein L34E